jgi:hypothetical protein
MYCEVAFSAVGGYMVSAKVTGPIHPAKPIPILLELLISAALTLVSFALFTDALLTNPYQYQYK